jgi:predicted O-methyltransferase YrrM
MQAPLPLGERLMAYVAEHSRPEPDLLAELRTTTRRMRGWNMQVTPEQGRFLSMIVRATGARRALEIGVYTGYSLLCTALALPPDGRVVACEKDPDWAGTARRHCERAGVADQVDIRVGDASATLDALIAEDPEPFDVVFVDADKENYRSYYEKSLRLLRTGGLMLVDNVLWNGRVADPEFDDPETLALRDFNRFVRDDQRVDLSMISFADGITLALKR